MTKNNTPEGTYEQYPQTERPAEPEFHGESRSFVDYIHVLRKRKWIPIACIIVFIAIAAIYSFKATPMYRASARVEIEQASANVFPSSIEDVVTVDTRYWDYLDTQLKVLQSRSLAEGVAKELTTAENPKDRQEDKNLTKKSILGMVRIERVGKSRLVDVIGVSPIPGQATRIANTLAEAYVDQDRNKRVEAIREAAQKLRTELEKAKKDADDSEAKFTAYKKQHSIVSLSEKQNLVLEELSNLNEAAAAARTERLRKEARYNDLKALSLEKLRHEEEVVSNQLIRNLKTEEFNAEQRVKKLAQTYGVKHPKMESAKKELASIQKDIDGKIQKVVDEVHNSYLKAKSEEERLVEAVETKKGEVVDFNSRVSEYGSIEREVEANRAIYQEILRRSRESGISERTEESNVRIVDNAEVPEAPFSPRTKFNIALAIIAGLFVGCGGAYFAEHVNQTVVDPESVERIFNRPFLGTVPEVAGTGASGGFAKSDKGKKKAKERAKERAEKEAEIIKGFLESTLSEERRKRLHASAKKKREYYDTKNKDYKTILAGRVAALRPKSGEAEAYKHILAGIQYSTVSNSLKRILVTSAGQGEGKTTTLTNLGISAAQNGKKVLLVDCDLRRPNVHKVFGMNRKEKGLTDYLIGEASLDEIVKKKEIKKPESHSKKDNETKDEEKTDVFVVPRGTSTPNPIRLISSDRMKKFVEEVKDQYDLILFDSPPCTLVADPLVLAKIVDGVINVTRSNRSRTKMVKRGMELLASVKANILGIVLNQMKERDRQYYYYGRYGYGGYRYRYLYRYRYRYSYYSEDSEEEGEEGEEFEEV